MAMYILCNYWPGWVPSSYLLSAVPSVLCSFLFFSSLFWINRVLLWFYHTSTIGLLAILLLFLNCCSRFYYIFFITVYLYIILCHFIYSVRTGYYYTSISPPVLCVSVIIHFPYMYVINSTAGHYYCFK